METTMDNFRHEWTMEITIDNRDRYGQWRQQWTLETAMNSTNGHWRQ